MMSPSNKNFMPGSARLSDKTFQQFSSYIHKHYGIQLPPVKKIMLESRLRKRLRELGIHSFEAYADHVFTEGNTDEMINMVDAVTTNKTDFFRENHHFELLSQTLLPLIAQQNSGSRSTIKCWSAACSTGEEPYTLAMVISEFVEKHPALDYSITATDLSTKVLHHASRAIYAVPKIEPVAMSLRKKYLLRSKDSKAQRVRIVPMLRKKICFHRINLLENHYPKVNSFDLVFCRNVFIYFDRETQFGILKKMCATMRPGAYLFIGHSETLNGMDLPLKVVESTVYQKI